MPSAIIRPVPGLFVLRPNREPSDRPLRLVRARSDAVSFWPVRPPDSIPPRSRADIWLSDITGPFGSAGGFTYSDGAQSLDFAFTCPHRLSATTCAHPCPWTTSRGWSRAMASRRGRALRAPRAGALLRRRSCARRALVRLRLPQRCPPAATAACACLPAIGSWRAPSTCRTRRYLMNGRRPTRCEPAGGRRRARTQDSLAAQRPRRDDRFGPGRGPGSPARRQACPRCHDATGTQPRHERPAGGRHDRTAAGARFLTEEGGVAGALLSIPTAKSTAGLKR